MGNLEAKAIEIATKYATQHRDISEPEDMLKIDDAFCDDLAKLKIPYSVEVAVRRFYLFLSTEVLQGAT